MEGRIFCQKPLQFSHGTDGGSRVNRKPFGFYQSAIDRRHDDFWICSLPKNSCTLSILLLSLFCLLLLNNTAFEQKKYVCHQDLALFQLVYVTFLLAFLFWSEMRLKPPVFCQVSQTKCKTVKSRYIGESILSCRQKSYRCAFHT